MYISSGGGGALAPTLDKLVRFWESLPGFISTLYHRRRSLVHVEILSEPIGKTSWLRPWVEEDPPAAIIRCLALPRVATATTRRGAAAAEALRVKREGGDGACFLKNLKPKSYSPE